MATVAKVNDGSINFFLCNLDCRNAGCEHRHVDANGNQPLALCEAETKRQEIKGKGLRLFFKTDCAYRSVLTINMAPQKVEANPLTKEDLPGGASPAVDQTAPIAPNVLTFPAPEAPLPTPSPTNAG